MNKGDFALLAVVAVVVMIFGYVTTCLFINLLPPFKVMIVQ